VTVWEESIRKMISAITSVVGRGFVVAAGGCVDVGNGSIVPRRKI